ncbi:EamA family transporter [Methylomonas methanica]|uniref:EamA family transporter n=1 Tax=Methylomonas methanica TaxID=421 RepID=UPI0007C8BB05|nr:EamA family transporter [Methylomonas methanica]
MAPRHIALALLCVLVWGGSFSVIRWGLQDLPPLAFASLRFGLVALLIPFVPRPNTSWRTIVVYGLGWGAVQFSGLFLAIHHGMPTSLSSVLAQSQVFFTMLFGMILRLESLNIRKGLSLGLALAGLSIIASDESAEVPTIAMALSLMGAAGWASGNIVVRMVATAGQRSDSLAFVVWASLIPAVILACLSAEFENHTAIFNLNTATSVSVTIAVLYQSLGALLIGTLAWNRLLRHYPATTVASFSLLTPIIGLSIGCLFWGETLSISAFVGSTLLLFGLISNLSVATVHAK